MTPNVQRLINDFANLSESDKIEVAEFFKRYRGSVVGRESNTRTYTQRNERILGPTANATCPFCGK